MSIRLITKISENCRQSIKYFYDFFNINMNKSEHTSAKYNNIHKVKLVCRYRFIVPENFKTSWTKEVT